MNPRNAQSTIRRVIRDVQIYFGRGAGEGETNAVEVD